MADKIRDAIKFATNETNIAEMKKNHGETFLALGDQAEQWIQSTPHGMLTFKEGQWIITKLSEALKPDQDKYYTACLRLKQQFEAKATSNLATIAAMMPNRNAHMFQMNAEARAFVPKHILVQTEDDLQDAFRVLRRERMIGVICEGENLSKGSWRDGDLHGEEQDAHGQLQMLIIGTTAGDKVYRLDIVNLGPKAFDKGIRQLLQNTSIIKVVCDFRQGNDALWHQFRVRCNNLFDCQFGDMVIRRLSSWYNTTRLTTWPVKGLETLVRDYGLQGYDFPLPHLHRKLLAQLQQQLTVLHLRYEYAQNLVLEGSAIYDRHFVDLPTCRCRMCCGHMDSRFDGCRLWEKLSGRFPQQFWRQEDLKPLPPLPPDALAPGVFAASLLAMVAPPGVLAAGEYSAPGTPTSQATTAPSTPMSRGGWTPGSGNAESAEQPPGKLNTIGHSESAEQLEAPPFVPTQLQMSVPMTPAIQPPQVPVQPHAYMPTGMLPSTVEDQNPGMWQEAEHRRSRLAEEAEHTELATEDPAFSPPPSNPLSRIASREPYFAYGKDGRRYEVDDPSREAPAFVPPVAMMAVMSPMFRHQMWVSPHASMATGNPPSMAEAIPPREPVDYIPTGGSNMD